MQAGDLLELLERRSPKTRASALPPSESASLGISSNRTHDRVVNTMLTILFAAATTHGCGPKEISDSDGGRP
jgi:hypothetical protein